MMKIAMAQITCNPGCVQDNVEKIKKYISKAHEEGANIVVFPELSIPGYPALDLYLNEDFQNECDKGLRNIFEFSDELKDILIIVGNIGTDYGNIYNEAVAISDSKILCRYQKQLLPKYDIFFEERYFSPGPRYQSPFEFMGKKIGLLICEDLWSREYSIKPYPELMNMEPNIVISINASPYSYDKQHSRQEVIQGSLSYSTSKLDCFAYVNAVGGQDGYVGEIVFDGDSIAFVYDPFKQDIKEAAYCGVFEEKMVVVDTKNPEWIMVPPEIDNIRNVHNALVLGIKSYYNRCGLKKAVIGLSGGIDSAVTASLAVTALGAENVLGVTMPSDYSSTGSVTDSELLAKNLRIKILNRPIISEVKTYRNNLQADFYETGRGEIKGTLTEENLQARIRGQILMAFANSEPGTMVLSTGNKTELALGYCTSYGDMVGGMSPIADCDKIMVYQLAKEINRLNRKEIIPQTTIDKPPSAELAPGQTDEAGLGAGYDVISIMVNQIVEKGFGRKKMIEIHGEENTHLIDKYLWLIKVNEWKRRQASPGIRVTEKAFGSGRRIPMNHKFTG